MPEEAEKAEEKVEEKPERAEDNVIFVGRNY